MATQIIAYSRLENHDYRLIYAPSKQLLSEPDRSEFTNFIREVINSDNFGSITAPRFAMIKRGDKCLIGVGCNNNFLGEVDTKIESREVRGFYGIVSDEPITWDQICLLCDSEISFYKAFFSKYIIPIWHTSKRDEDSINSIVEPIRLDVDTFPLSYIDIPINQDKDCCQIHSYVSDHRHLIYSCSLVKNGDIVVNINSEAHVISAPLYHFHNVTILNDKQNRLIEFNKKKHLEPVENLRVVRKNKSCRNETPFTKENGCISRCIDKVEHFLGKYDISPMSFLKAFAKRHHMKVVKDVPNDGNIIGAHSSLEEINQGEIHHPSVSSEVEDFQKKKAHRRSFIEDLQAKFKENNSIEEEIYRTNTVNSEETHVPKNDTEIESLDT